MIRKLNLARPANLPRRAAPRLVAVPLAALALLLTASAALAHVSIRPSAAPPNTNETFSARVPTEKDSPTVRVRIEFPDGMTVSRFQPKPGWSRADQRDTSGRITAATWSGGRIENGEFDEFVFIARTPPDAATLRFRAFQTYADGETVEWINDADPRSAPTLEVRAAVQTAAASGEHGQAAAPGASASPSASTPAPTAAATARSTAAAITSGGTAQSSNAAGATSPSAGSDLPLFIALGSGVLALLALALAGVAVARRPPSPSDPSRAA